MQTHVVITGANRGIGLELCRYYQSCGAQTIAVCRSRSNELEALKVQIIDDIDVSKAQDIVSLSEQLKGVSIDILINNAGILSNQTLDDMDFQAISEQFEVNTLGPLRLVDALLGHLHEGSKVALITSRMGSITDNTSGAYYGYRMSKAALNAAGMSLAQDLRPRNIAVTIIHPGFVKTGMTGFAGDITPTEAARNISQRIEELDLTSTGVFLHSNGTVLPW